MGVEESLIVFNKNKWPNIIVIQILGSFEETSNSVDCSRFLGGFPDDFRGVIYFGGIGSGFLWVSGEYRRCRLYVIVCVVFSQCKAKSTVRGKSYVYSWNCSLAASAWAKFVKIIFATDVSAKVDCLVATEFAKSTVEVDVVKSAALKVCGAS